MSITAFIEGCSEEISKHGILYASAMQNKPDILREAFDMNYLSDGLSELTATPRVMDLILEKNNFEFFDIFFENYSKETIKGQLDGYNWLAILKKNNVAFLKKLIIEHELTINKETFISILEGLDVNNDATKFFFNHFNQTTLAIEKKDITHKTLKGLSFALQDFPLKNKDELIIECTQKTLGLIKEVIFQENVAEGKKEWQISKRCKEIKNTLTVYLDKFISNINEYSSDKCKESINLDVLLHTKLRDCR